jgi:hypothetical protein
VGVWVLSFPLVVAHQVSPASVPTAAVSATAPDASDSIARQFRVVRPPLVIGQLAVPAVFEAVRPPAPVVVPVAVRPAPPRPAPQAPPAPAPTVAVPANTLVIPRLGVRQHVSDYTDCTGAAGVPHWDVWRWTCAGTNNVYVMAHNPGIFTPILGLQVGDIIQYGDPAGVVHTYKVVSTTIVSYTDTSPMNALSVPSITLQTCWNFDGTQDFIVRAVQI